MEAIRKMFWSDKPNDLFETNGIEICTNSIPTEIQRGRSNRSILRNAMNQVGELPAFNCLRSFFSFDRRIFRVGAGLGGLILVQQSIPILNCSGALLRTAFEDPGIKTLPIVAMTFFTEELLSMITSVLIGYAINKNCNAVKKYIKAIDCFHLYYGIIKGYSCPSCLKTL